MTDDGGASGLRWEVVLNAVPDAILLFDAQQRIVFANAAAKRLFERSDSSLLGTRAETLMAPGYTERFSRLHQAALAASPLEARPPQTELGVRRSDGGQTQVEAELGVAEGSGGETLVICSLRDITLRRAAEEQQARLENALNRSRRVESIGQLAGGVAHDFNNLLAVVLNYATFVGEGLPEDSALHEDLGEIRTAAERGAALTRQLLIFSRREMTDPEILNLNQTIRNLEKLLRRTLGEHIDLDIKLEEDLWSVEVDPAQIEQAIMNLVLNARDSMQSGGSLEIDTRNVDLDEIYSEENPEMTPGPYVRVTVTDTGPGIEMGEVEHVFEPFYSSSSGAQGGGLGLAAVHGVVTAAGGQITVYSEAGIGTAFKVHLPAVGGDLHADPPEAEADWPTGTVLVAEDEPAVLRMTSRVLERGGHTVLQAVDGPAALALLAEHSAEVDLLLADVVMPGMSGPELADRVAETHPDMPVLFMSGYTEEMISKRDLITGEVTLLEKPFTAARLLRAIGRALSAAAG